MSYLLKHIKDWPERAGQANWSVQGLARQCGVSTRTIQTFFQRATGESPHSWMTRERLRRAIELLRDGSTVKEAANLLGYKHQNHFARTFKKHYGKPPTQHGELADGKIGRGKELRV